MIRNLKMKTQVILISLIFTSIFAYGQNQTDVIKVAPKENSGTTNGITYITYKNSKLKESGKYDRNGKQTGEWKYYTQNEVLESIGEHLNGEKHGEWNDFYPNGKILKKGNYTNGKQAGEWKAYHSNGQLASVEKYTNGKQIGKTELYNLQGKNTTQKALDNDIKDQMKTDFEKFYTLLQQKNFEQAINFVSEDYLNETRFSKEQMKNMLRSNFDNWEILPDLKVELKEIEIQKPKNIIKQGNKSFGVVETVMNFEMTITGNYSKAEIGSTVGLIETIGKDRYKMGKILQKEGVTVIYIKDKRLVAAIYNHSTQNVSFAMAEMGLKYSFEQFLPKEIIEQIKAQL